MTDDTNDRLTVKEMLTGSGATFRQLDYWWRRGYFTSAGPVPRGPVAPGSGYSRGWTERELTIASLIVRMSAAGIEVAHAAEFARDAVDAGRTEVTTDSGITIAWGNVA